MKRTEKEILSDLEKIRISIDRAILLNDFEELSELYDDMATTQRELIDSKNQASA